MARQHILLIDSDERSLRVMEVSLRQAGHSVSTARDGESAWAKIESERPALLISEISGLGSLDGFALAERLRASAEGAHTPFIFLTKDTSTDARARSAQVGADDFLGKPVYMGELLSRVKLLLQKQERAGLESGEQEQFFGRLEETGMVDLLRIIEGSARSKKSGRLVVEHQGRRGELWFDDGEIIDARCGARSGEEALYRLLTWERGQFEVHFEPVQTSRVIRSPMDRLLNEGLRRVDTWARICEQLPDLNTVFRVDATALRERAGELSEETKQLTSLFDGQRSALDILDLQQGSDIDTLSAISQLYFESLIYEVRSRYEQGEPDPVFVEGASVGFTPLPESALDRPLESSTAELDRELFTPETAHSNDLAGYSGAAVEADEIPALPPQDSAALPPPIDDALLKTPEPEEREVGQDLLQDLYRSAAQEFDEPPPPPPPSVFDDGEAPPDIFAEGAFDAESQDFFENLDEEGEDFSDLIAEESAGPSRPMVIALIVLLSVIGGGLAFATLRDTVEPLENRFDVDVLALWHQKNLRERPELNLHDFSPSDPIPRLEARWESDGQDSDAVVSGLPPELTPIL
ncbi:MAG: DUF4388 domain-containing protein, partial [Myxococcota bacterium]|nr:DUF4388 domain-containing protein [Myxococcota bacterium]